MNFQQRIREAFNRVYRNDNHGLQVEEIKRLMTDAGKQDNADDLLPTHQPQEKAKRNTIGKILTRISILIFAVSYALLLWSYTQQAKLVRERYDKSGAQFYGNEGIYADAPKSLATFPFSRAGFHSNDSTVDPKTEFEGRPDVRNNAAWHHILNVGVIAISEVENSRLPNGGSAAVRGHPEEHVVLLAMFHQLHCLKYLRDLIYDFDDGTISANDKDDYRVSHGDHCIDYLRQSLMCHGDITPIIQDWQPQLHGYSARQDTVHQCRNFDEIWNWAAERNTTGMRADGQHKGHHLE